jgi:hypothetical protein
MSADVELVDAEERHVASVFTFEIPAAMERVSLRVNDLAKVIFEGDGIAERIWTRVLSVESRGRYRVRLASEPLADLPRRFEIEAKHVIDIERTKVRRLGKRSRK